MPIKTDPKTGNVIFLDDSGKWSAARTAVNPQTNETVAFDGKAWQPVPSAPTDLAGTAADVAKSGGIGLVKGGLGLAGMPGDIGSLISIGAEKAAQKLGVSPETITKVKNVTRSAVRGMPLLAPFAGPGTAEIKANVEKLTGPLYEPKTVAGQYAQTIGEFAPAAAAGPGGLVRRGLTQVALPALASESAGQLTKGTEAEPYWRVAGALAAPAAASLLTRGVTPFPASLERQNLVRALENEGVYLTAGKTTGSRPLRWAESVLEDTPLVASKARRIAEREHEQFTGAALRKVGENAPRATPEVIDNAFTRVGKQFDDLAARNAAPIDNKLANDMRGALDEYYNLVAPPNRTPAVTNYVKEMMNAASANNGVIPGPVYQSLRSRMERTARGLRNNPEAQTAIRDMRESLDGAMERAMASSGNHADLGAWREARRQYRNLLVVEKAATGAGENAAQGLISPSQLRTAVKGQNRRAYARGRGDFADLARAGEALMKPLPQSGTPPRLGAMKGFGLTAGGVAGGTVGGTLGGAMGSIPGALLGAGIGIGTPATMGHLLLSKPVQWFLANQAIARGQPGRATAAMSPIAIANALNTPSRQ